MYKCHLCDSLHKLHATSMSNQAAPPPSVASNTLPPAPFRTSPSPYFHCFSSITPFPVPTVSSCQRNKRQSVAYFEILYAHSCLVISLCRQHYVLHATSIARMMSMLCSNFKVHLGFIIVFHGLVCLIARNYCLWLRVVVLHVNQIETSC